MDTRLLRSFLSVSRWGSFTDAATELGYTQSTVTSHVQKLEREPGARLLDRLPGGAVPTDLGSRLIGHAEDVLAAEEGLRAASSAGEARPTGTVRIMAPETLCTYWLPTVIGALKRAEPGIQIWLSPGGVADALDSVRRGIVDLAVTMEPWVPTTDMDLTHLGRQDLVFLAPCDPPAQEADDQRAATWAELADRDALLIERCGYSDAVADQLSSTGRSLGRRTRFGSVEAIKRGVSAGLGWTVLPTIAVEDERRAGSVAVLDGPALTACDVNAVSHPRRHKSAATRAVLDEMRRSWPVDAMSP